MILRSVTLNPAIDQTVTLDRLVPGEVHRAVAVHSNAGGKGINVASCLADWFGTGARIEALGLLGADNSTVFEALFSDKGIRDRMIRLDGETRTNIKLVAAGDTTDINLPGFEADGSVMETLERQFGDLGAGDVVVIAGSLPRGLAPETCADLVARARARAARVILDTSGAPLALALAAGVLPDVVKPNRHELEDWAGHRLTDRAAVLAAARDLQAGGIALVVVSLGAEGALFCSAEAAVHACLPVVTGGSSVGAGDAMVSGIAVALTEARPLEEIARLGTAFAAAKLSLPGPNLPPRSQVEALMRSVEIRSVTDWAAAVVQSDARR
jgi:1-phosphofructokinase